MAAQRRRRSFQFQESSAEDGCFFDFQKAKLPGPRPRLDHSSSSDEQEIMSDDENEEKDFAATLQQLLTISTDDGDARAENSQSKTQRKPFRFMPAKYFADETGRRWKTAPMVKFGDQDSFPHPKHQNGRSKIPAKGHATNAVELWQFFVPDQFLETFASSWFVKNAVDNVDAKQTGKGKKAKEKSTAMESDGTFPVLDELKAFFAILYARLAFGDSSTFGFEDYWKFDSFAPSFFAGAMDKETFFNYFKRFLDLSSASIQCNVAPPFLNDFNYRLAQSFEPGDTLAICDRTVVVTRTDPTSNGGEQAPPRKLVISCLRDARSGFYFKMAPPVLGNLNNDTIAALSHTQTEGASKMVSMDETLRFLLGQSPILQSGRTVYVSQAHAGVQCARELYSKYKLRLVGQLPSGRLDSGVPFIAKSRSLLKRTVNSTLFLFDYPLSLISYQRQPVRRNPELLVSTAHFSKEKSPFFACNGVGVENNDAPPSAWSDYQNIRKDSADQIGDFSASLLIEGDITSLPADRLSFLDCLYAAAFNAFVLWDVQHATDRNDDRLGRLQDFRLFLRRLACQLARPYVVKRLESADGKTTPDSNRGQWRIAAKQILIDADLNVLDSVARDKKMDSSNHISCNGQVKSYDLASALSAAEHPAVKKLGKGRGKLKK